jgi:palmitoyl-protein thioesterase
MILCRSVAALFLQDSSHLSFCSIEDTLFYANRNFLSGYDMMQHLQEQLYLDANIFLPDINNALPIKNSTYKRNIMGLKNFVMVKFLQDMVVQPRDSEWFGFYASGQDTVIETLHQSKLYTEDWLGLKVLDQTGRLHFLATPGDHLQFTDKWFVNAIINGWLRN